MHVSDYKRWRCMFDFKLFPCAFNSYTSVGLDVPQKYMRSYLQIFNTSWFKLYYTFIFRKAFHAT